MTIDANEGTGDSERIRIDVDGTGPVSAFVDRASGAWACFVFAHGAGAGMDHAFMRAFARGLVDRGVTVLRYQFPARERGSGRVDPPAIAQATVRRAVHEASRVAPSLPLFAGGKSYGGRMTSGAQAADPLPSVSGLVFVGFPLHPADRPGTDRAVHLSSVSIPMLFLQGTRDTLARLDLIEGVVRGLGSLATIEVIDDADHAFHVRARSGRDDAAAMHGMLDATVAWMRRVLQ